MALFFMITGYFSISKDKIQTKNIVLETLFYSICLSSFGVILGVDSASKAFIKSPLAIINGDYWFVSSYLFLALCIPKLNQYFNSLSIKRKCIFVGIVYCFFYFLPYIFASKYYDLVRGLFFYLMGGLLKLFVKSTKGNILIYRLKKNRIIFLIGFLTVWLIDATIKFIYYEYDVCDIEGLVIDRIVHNGILIPAAAVLLFVFTILTDKYENSVINCIASTTFGVYLIHDSSLRYFIWNGIFNVNLQYMSDWFPILSIGTGIMVFLTAALLDLLRIKVLRRVHLKKHFDCIDLTK